MCVRLRRECETTMSEANFRTRDARSRKLHADVAGLGAIDRGTLGAVRKLQAEEAQLHKRLLADVITAEEHFLLWSALRKRTPPEVHHARLKIERSRAEAGRTEPGGAEG
jgi:hypothetical protein